MKTTYKPLGEMVLLEWAVLRKIEKAAKFTSRNAGEVAVGEDDHLVTILTDLGSSEIAGAEQGDFVIAAVDIPPPSPEKPNGHFVPAKAIIGKEVSDYGDDYELVMFKELI